MYVDSGTQTLASPSWIRVGETSGSSLELLSNEILFMVIDCLLDDLRARFEGDDRHIPLGSLCIPPCDFQQSFEYQSRTGGRNTERKFIVADFRSLTPSSLIGLAALASTSKRLQAIAQPKLFKAPCLSVGRHNQFTEVSPLYLFARTLLERPELRKATTSLRIDMPGSWGGDMERRTSGPLEVHRRGAAFIDALDWMHHDAKTGWKWQLQRLRPEPFCAIILSLLDNLKELYLLKVAGCTGDVFSDLFWATSAPYMSDEGRALRSLRHCPGLANLEYFRTDSVESLSRSPILNITTLTSLHLAFTDSNRLFHDLRPKSLHRITTLRFDCDFMADCFYHTPTQAVPLPLPSPNIPPSPPPGVYTIPLPLITVHGPPPSVGGLSHELLAALPSLETLELFANVEASYETYQSRFTGYHLRGKRYYDLVQQCAILAPTLRKLVLPRGWWAWPNNVPWNVRFSDEPTSEGEQVGAYTGSIANFSLFTRLQTLVVHSTAIIAKGTHDTEVADAIMTLPASIRDITVYGAHDGLWSWVGEILCYRGSHFPFLKSITLLREEPVDGLSLLPLSELGAVHEILWKEILGSTVLVRVDP